LDEQFEALAERFRRLGADAPEAWARSEIEEDIPQLARFVLLRFLWSLVIPENDRSWFRSAAGRGDDGQGGALRRLLAAGVSRDDLTAVVRERQIALLHEVVSVLDGLLDRPSDAEGVTWGLFETDAGGRPGRPIDGLHESLDDVGGSVS
jgi:hypothetical protein